MQSFVFVIFIGLVVGASVGLQSPLASMITQRLGMIESVVIIHISGTIAGMLALFVSRKGVGNLGQWRELPYGLLGAAVRPMTLPRFLGISVMFLGVWLTVRE
jgi:uncharacterized membrane protein YdcZ (DUF606 family)